MLIQEEKKSLWTVLSNFLSNIFGPKSSTVVPDYAGFTIEQLFINYQSNLLNLLENNFRAITETDGIPDANGQEGVVRQETTVGWFIKLNKPTGTGYAGYPNVSLQPSGITQLVFEQKKENGQDRFGYKTYPVNVSLNLIDASNDGSISTLSPTYKEYRISQYLQDDYLSEIEATTSKTNSQLQFFEAGTNAVFFSRSQLLMMLRLLRQHPDKTILFTGYKYDLGRAGAQHHMYEFKYLDHTLGGKPAIPEWFSLKAELVFNHELEVGTSHYQGTTSPPITEDIDFDGYLEQNCNLGSSAKSAVLFLGYTCPPGWAAVAPALDATYAAIDHEMASIEGSLHSKELLCALLKEIKMAGHDGTGTP